MNTHRFISALIFLAIFSASMAQEVDERNQKIQAMKVAFITEKINLTTKEAQQFWPVYNEWQDKRSKINAQLRTTREFYVQNAASLSDKQIEETLNKLINLQQQDVNLLAEYNKKYMQILPVKKVMDLYIAENQFKAWIISKLRGTAPVNAPRRK